MSLLTVHNGDCYTTPRALLILEAQATLARFLRDFVELVCTSVDELTIEETSRKFGLMSLETERSLQSQDSPWLYFGMDYYNVRNIRSSCLLP